MKELESPLQQKSLDKNQIVNEQLKKYEIKLIGSQRMIPGLTLWEFNVKDKTIKKAHSKNAAVQYNEQLGVRDVRYQVMLNQDCVYIQALNVQNAMKKLYKLGLL